MSFFTHILNFPRALLARLRDQRKQTRHRVGADFPLKATVSLSGYDGSVRKTAGGPGSDWAGRPWDVSKNGLSVRLPPASAAARGEATVVRISLEGRELAIPGTVAYHRVYATHALCGLRLVFDDFAVQKSWLQIVEAVSRGAAFEPVGGERAPRPSLGLARRQWRGPRQARLTEWRETGTRKLDRFELILEEHRFEGRMTEPGMKIAPASGRAKPPAPAVEAELRQLFRWVVGNLPASVPADLREFMSRAAATQATGKPAAPKRGSRPPIPSKPPSEWDAPSRPPRTPA